MTDAADLLNMSNRQLWLVCDVLDAARAHVNDPDIELPADWNIPHTPTFAALDAAVRALDEETE